LHPAYASLDPPNKKSSKNSSAAYITYDKVDDAQAAIESVDMFQYDGRLIRASFGTSKYCNAFLRGIQCSNPDCLYLHAMGKNEDSFSKEQIQQGYANRGGLQDVSKVSTAKGGRDPTGSSSSLPPRVGGKLNHKQGSDKSSTPVPVPTRSTSPTAISASTPTTSSAAHSPAPAIVPNSPPLTSMLVLPPSPEKGPTTFAKIAAKVTPQKEEEQ
jgi:CCR4-NOT transcription complex subunit 4